MFNRKPTRFGLAILAVPLLILGNAVAQNEHRNDDFYNGMREGSRGARYDQGHDRRYRNDDDRGGYDPRRNENRQYDNQRYSNQQYDNRQYGNQQYQDQHQGGIGPGKGALIGGAGGAILGAIFGGGLKGSLIGGAAGAGIGAVAGKVHQDHTRRRNYNEYPR